AGQRNRERDSGFDQSPPRFQRIPRLARAVPRKWTLGEGVEGEIKNGNGTFLQYTITPTPSSYCFHSKNSSRTPSGPSKKQTLRPSGSTRSSRIFKPAVLILLTSPSKLFVSMATCSSP